MTKKFKLKDVKQSLLRTCHALKFLAMFLGFALIVQLISLPNLFAQENSKHKVTGKVTSATDNSPLPGANVTIKGTTNGTITDLDG